MEEVTVSKNRIAFCFRVLSAKRLSGYIWVKKAEIENRRTLDDREEEKTEKAKRGER